LTSTLRVCRTCLPSYLPIASNTRGGTPITDPMQIRMWCHWRRLLGTGNRGAPPRTRSTRGGARESPSELGRPWSARMAARPIDRIRMPISSIGHGRENRVLQQIPWLMHYLPAERRIPFTRKHLGPPPKVVVPRRVDGKPQSTSRPPSSMRPSRTVKLPCASARKALASARCGWTARLLAPATRPTSRGSPSSAVSCVNKLRAGIARPGCHATSNREWLGCTSSSRSPRPGLDR
jgi:hypothetical protein